MKQTPTLVKLAAIGSTAVLIAAFVSYRAGAFDRVIESKAPSTATGNLDIADSADSGSTPPSSEPIAPEKINPILISGSKSSKIFIPPKSDSQKKPADSQPPQAPASPKAPPAFIGGSKSLAPLIPPKSSAPAQQAPAPGK